MLPEIAPEVKQTAFRIVKIANEMPERELIDDEGKQKVE